MSSGKSSGYAHRLRVYNENRGHNGFRRHDSDGWEHMHGRHGKVLSGFHCGGIMRKMRALQGGIKADVEVLEAITSGKGEEKHLRFLQEMGEAVKKTALCGLGQTAPNPVLTTLKYFIDEYKTHINDKNCPAHVCGDLIKFEVIEEKCVKCGLCFKACPVGAIEWEPKKIAKINKEKCIKCKACIEACRFKAIK